MNKNITYFNPSRTSIAIGDNSNIVVVDKPLRSNDQRLKARDNKLIIIHNPAHENFLSFISLLLSKAKTANDGGKPITGGGEIISCLDAYPSNRIIP